VLELAKKDRPEGIWVGDMEDGDVGVTVSWVGGYYLDTIVQRFGDMEDSPGLIILGKKGNWKDVLSMPKSCRVRLLEKGETLVVV